MKQIRKDIKGSIMKPNLLILACTLVFALSISVHADDIGLLAQFEEAGEHYDPFADYSEFEEASEEEADVHFFTNGRLLNFGGLFGARLFTGELGKQESMFGLGGGVFLNFFFNLRNAFQISYFRTGHKLENTFNQVHRSVENTTLSELDFDFKYYFNTQNVTKGLAAINPYVALGIGWIRRIQKFNWRDSDDPVDERHWGFNSGLGVEFPMMRNTAYFGVEARFQYVMFSDENDENEIDICGFESENCEEGEERMVGNSEFGLAGDLINVIAFIGFNF